MLSPALVIKKRAKIKEMDNLSLERDQFVLADYTGITKPIGGDHVIPQKVLGLIHIC